LKDSDVSVLIVIAVIGPLDMGAASGWKYSHCFGDWLCLRLQIWKGQEWSTMVGHLEGASFYRWTCLW